MVILNFTVPFALEAIPKGLKKRTMRPVRANPNSVWNRLYEKFKKLHHGMWGCPTCGDSGDYMDECNETETCFQNNSKCIIPLVEQSGENLKIELQLWWQQRSRYYRCDCGQTRVLQKDLGKCCEKCMTLAVFKEAHKLADAVLTNMTKRKLGSLSEEEWQADGFDITNTIFPSSKDMGLCWFAQTYEFDVGIVDNIQYIYPIGLLNLEVYIIEWELV